jgi:hypothetical protein
VSAPKVRNREEYWTLRTARKGYLCEVTMAPTCAPIFPGVQYIVAELPPGGETGGLTWERMKFCLACGRHYHADLVAQLTATPPQ